jgi:hypothetical protein
VGSLRAASHEPLPLTLTAGSLPVLVAVARGSKLAGVARTEEERAAITATDAVKDFMIAEWVLQKASNGGRS